jgi:serralysin
VLHINQAFTAFGVELGGHFSGGGNSLPNRIVGNSGNNLLSGGLGADTLVGGLGDDIYVLTDLLDTIEDEGGLDLIRSSASVDLMSYTAIEKVELIGVAHASVTGNSLDNDLTGNSGDNYLEGGLGVDSMSGGQGGDGFYLVWNGSGVPADLIRDFDPQFDLLMIDVVSFGVDPMSAGSMTSGFADPAVFVRARGAVAADSDDRLLFDTAAMVLRFDLDGVGPAPALDVARFAGASNLQLQAQQVFFSV